MQYLFRQSTLFLLITLASVYMTFSPKVMVSSMALLVAVFSLFLSAVCYSMEKGCASRLGR